MGGPNLVSERVYLLGHEKGAFGHGTGAFGAWKGHTGNFEQGLGAIGLPTQKMLKFSLVL